MAGRPVSKRVMVVCPGSNTPEAVEAELVKFGYVSTHFYTQTARYFLGVLIGTGGDDHLSVYLSAGVPHIKCHVHLAVPHGLRQDSQRSLGMS